MYILNVHFCHAMSMRIITKSRPKIPTKRMRYELPVTHMDSHLLVHTFDILAIPNQPRRDSTLLLWYSHMSTHSTQSTYALWLIVNIWLQMIRWLRYAYTFYADTSVENVCLLWMSEQWVCVVFFSVVRCNLFLIERCAKQKHRSTSASRLSISRHRAIRWTWLFRSE